MLKKILHPFGVVITVSIAVAFTNSITFFYHLFREPAGTIYLGTVHYWEDYFFYLNHFFQGAHGAVLTVNRYTSEPTPDSIIYWSNVLLGKIGGLFFLPPVLSYNLSLIILSFTVLVTSYILISKILHRNTGLALPAFLFATFATSLINRVRSDSGQMILWPFQIWRTPHFVFDRLGGAPHQIVQTILAYIFIISYDGLLQKPVNKKWLAVAAVSLVLLTTINPIQSVYYLGMIWGARILVQTAGYLRTKKFPGISVINPLPLLILTAATGLAALYINYVLSQPPHVQSKIWEASQHSYTDFIFLIKSLGPVSWLAAVGLIVRLKKITEIELFGVLTIISGYAIFMSRIPQTVGFSNLRILFPASYVFWGVFAAYGAWWLARKLAAVIKKTAKKSHGLLSANSILGIIVFLYLLIASPTIWWEINFKLPQKDDSADPVIYLPRGIYAAFDFLANRKPYSDVVIAAPGSHIDTMVPAFSGHTVYAGHMLTTIDNSIKQKQAADLFNDQIQPDAARKFLTDNKIRYVLFTAYDGSSDNFKKAYPFLTPVFYNPQASIYEVK